MVEHLGLEPSSISLQGRSADPARAPKVGFASGGQTLPLGACTQPGEKVCPPRMHDVGAWSRFRARLSAASTQRFHQISFRAYLRLGRPTGIEPMSARWRRTALPLSYGRLSCWCTEQDSNLRSPKAPDLQ